MATGRLRIRVSLLLIVIGLLVIETRGDVYDTDIDLKNYVRYDSRTGIDIVWQSSKEDSPSDSCNLYGYYDPEMLSSTDLVTECFEDLRSLVHSNFLAGEFYYTNNYYYGSDVYPWCTVICLPSGGSSSTAANAGSSPNSVNYTTSFTVIVASLALAVANV